MKHLFSLRHTNLFGRASLYERALYFYSHENQWKSMFFILLIKTRINLNQECDTQRILQTAQNPKSVTKERKCSFFFLESWRISTLCCDFLPHFRCMLEIREMSLAGFILRIKFILYSWPLLHCTYSSRNIVAERGLMPMTHLIGVSADWETLPFGWRWPFLGVFQTVSAGFFRAAPKHDRRPQTRDNLKLQRLSNGWRRLGNQYTKRLGILNSEQKSRSVTLTVFAGSVLSTMCQGCAYLWSSRGARLKRTALREGVIVTLLVFCERENNVLISFITTQRH